VDLDARFEQAAAESKSLPAQPNEVLLELYGLYKQATEGDVRGSRPGMLDVRGRAKYDAWAKREGMSADEAKQAYVALVERLRGGA
jgi:acyl-CoA-binding protein